MSFYEYYISENAPYVGLFSPIHIIYILCVVALVALFIRKREYVKKHRDGIGKLFLGLFVFQQIFLYGWYAICTDVLVTEGLPLHLCRLNILIMIVYLITKKPAVMDIACYFTAFAMTSLIYPSAVFHFTHITMISYVISHVVPFLTLIYAYVAWGWKPSNKAFVKGSIAYIIYMIFVTIINPILSSNYFYLVDRPFLNSWGFWQFWALGCVGVILIFFVLTQIFIYADRRFAHH